MRTPARLGLMVVAVFATLLRAADLSPPLDFSSAGYRGGGVALPLVPAVCAVAPSGSDDTAAIQAALDAVARRPLDSSGMRGAVLLRPGSYRIDGQLRITASGVVLRGRDATLVATGESRRTLIQIAARNDAQRGPAISVAAEITAAGSTRLALANVDGLAPGMRVVVHRPSTREWIARLGMTGFPGPGQYKDARLDWVPGSRDIEWERTIVQVDGTALAVMLDAPITTALEKDFGGGTVQRLDWPGRLRDVGIEGLVCESAVDPSNPLDEEHAWIAVAVENAEDVWIRQIVARRFVCAAVWLGATARAVTVTDCVSAQPVAENAAWRRLGFYIGGQQILVQRCTSEEGRHEFAAGHCAAGPNVFLECRALGAKADAGPFESWASGVLYDRLSVAGAGLNLANIGTRTQGAGWTAANSVVWNSAAAGRIVLEDPPQAPNRVVVDPAVPSLYRAQLERRLGGAAVAASLDTALPSLASDDHGEALPKIDVPPAAPPPVSHPLAIENGYFVIDGHALLGGAMSSALWKGQLVPGRERDVGTSPTRWAPGRVGPTLTEDLPALADRMVGQHTAFYWSFPGLWYDRRRDDHSIAIRDDPDVWAPFFEPPWRLSGVGRNAMGLSRYDLTRFNPWYFARLHEFADNCTQRGLVLGCQLYDNHNVQEAAAHWADFPWRGLNALQDPGFPEPPRWENAAQNRHHIADEFYDPSHPVRRRFHELYIRHTLDVLGDSPNVIFTLGYQFAGPLAFEEFFLDTIAGWEREHGRRVHVALQTSKAVTDAILADASRAALIDIIDLRYWQYLPDGKLFAPDGQGKSAFRELRTEAFGRDAVMRSTPEFVYRQVREYRDRYPDKAIICGHAGFGPIPVVLAGGAGVVTAESTPENDGTPRRDQAFWQFAAETFARDLPYLKPVDGWAANAWCLGNPDRGYLVYSKGDSVIELTQPLPSSLLKAVWYDPKTGEQTTTLAESGARRLSKPTAEAWLLWVGRSSQ